MSSYLMLEMTHVILLILQKKKHFVSLQKNLTTNNLLKEIYKMNNMEHIVNTVRKYASTFGAFQIVFEDGEVYTCKTPVECKIGLYRILYMKKHPETYKHIMTIRLPEEEGTTYWMRQAYGKVV